ncbi:MAG: N-acetylmuramic acid 6-phosphate etherase [Bacteroidota bacterium]|jgi:N-acetylmuramic acid 6-phosphate etherase
MRLTTESTSHYDNLESKTIQEILYDMNQEDLSVPKAVQKALPQIEAFIAAAVERVRKGGKIFYIGAGTSGRLGVLDASEIPPTFGAPKNLFIGLIAGGDHALRNAVEFAEDNLEQAWKDMQLYSIGNQDIVLGIAASGTTPYVLGGLQSAQAAGCLTGCIVCNLGSPVAATTQFPMEIEVGPEFVTGSTRLKSGTATKLVLNMISTTLMIQIGRVQGNRMVDMHLANRKLIQRGTKILMETLKLEEQTANLLLKEQGSVRKAIDFFRAKNNM